MRLSWRWGVAVTAVCAGWACSQADPHPPLLGDPPAPDATIITIYPDSSTPTDAGAKETSTACPYDDAGCNTLPNCGNQIFVNQIALGPPGANGGTPLAGTYVLATYNLYTGPTGASGVTTTWFRETMTFTANADGGAEDFAWQDVSETSQAQTQVSTNGDALFSNTSLTLTDSCPSSLAATYGYNASPTTLVLLITQITGTAELIYSKQ